MLKALQFLYATLYVEHRRGIFSRLSFRLWLKQTTNFKTYRNYKLRIVNYVLSYTWRTSRYNILYIRLKIWFFIYDVLCPIINNSLVDETYRFVLYRFIRLTVNIIRITRQYIISNYYLCKIIFSDRNF